jgi:rRNA pseudouridine-1189 N-methylase Emg1 (Nep1/Mra1 family)
MMHMRILAKKMMLTPTQAVALPEVVTSAARECKMSEQQIIQSCYENGAVREYLASICRKVTA